MTGPFMPLPAEPLPAEWRNKNLAASKHEQKPLTLTLLPHPQNPKTLPTSPRKFSGKYLASDSIGSTMGQAYS